jgi:hypothetical protein
VRMTGLIAALAALAVAGPAEAQAPQAAAAAQDDPAALAEARAIVVKLLPPGTYKRLMGTTMGPLMDQMGESIGALPLKQLAQLGGLDAQQAAALDKVDLAQVMAIYDPHWQERSKLQMRAMFAGMGDFFGTVEPELRDAYARAFVHTFTANELKDLNRYFATPTGAKFAGRYMTMATDPAIMDVTKAMMPRMMAEMPRFVEAAQKATAGLPPPRKIETLTAAERAKLATALGIDPARLRNPDATP